MSDVMLAEKVIGRAARTRAALINAGRSLFAERPVDAVPIDDIVQAAGVAKGSFYNHFSDKDALVRAISAQIRSGVEQAVAAVNADIADPALRTVRGLCVYIRFATEDAERAATLLRIQGGHTALDAPLNRGLVEDVGSAKASGRFILPSVEAGVLMVMGVAQIALARIIEGGSATNPADLVEQLCAVLLRGFGLAPSEAQAIAAQAADDIIRTAAS
jgi:AcrR family transcriptional regulator